MAFLTLPKLHFAGRFEGFDVQFHSHGGHELLWVTHGPCRMRVGCHDLYGETDALLILPARVPHQQSAESLIRTSYVVFGDGDDIFDTTPRALRFAPDAPAKRWMDDLCEMSLQTPPLPPTIADALVLALLQYLAHLEAKQGIEITLHPALRTSLQWMESHLESPLKMAELMAHTHYSSSYLSDLFHRQFGCGPQAYHQKLRLERAARLLRNPYLRIAEVGQRCGYENPNFFARQFQRQHGRSPATYRRENGPPAN